MPGVKYKGNKVKYILSVFVILIVAGCGTHKMYVGTPLSENERSLVYIHESPVIRFKEIDGKKVDFVHDGKVLEFEPGDHKFLIEISGDDSDSKEPVSYYYHILLNMEPGFSYTHNFNLMGTIRSDMPSFTWQYKVPKELCFLGERHDAVGSSTNPTGEYRLMSQNAKLYGCSRIVKINDQEV